MFGEVADLYHRHRPSYPEALARHLVARSGVPARGRVLEVGAGTGKATAVFAACGAPVLAVEPSPGMAEAARRHLARYPAVDVVESDFERFDPGGERFPLLISAQAWHWIDPEVRYRRARAALTLDGVLAVFWNRPAWGPSPVRDALAEVYARLAPGMERDGPLHPANPAPAGDEDWAAEIAAVPEFASPEERAYRWSLDYTAAEYAGLLATLSEFRLLAAPARERLLSAVAETIDAHGGTLTMPMVTWCRTAVPAAA